MIDTQKDSYEMDYDALEQAITENTKAIIPVDIAGIICDYEKIFEIVEKKKSLFQAKGELQEKLKLTQKYRYRSVPMTRSACWEIPLTG